MGKSVSCRQTLQSNKVLDFPMESLIQGYSISRDDLVESYIRKHYSDYSVLIMFNVQNHLDYLNKKGFEISGTYVWDNEIMIFVFDNMDEAKYVLEHIDDEDAPFSQVWVFGKLVSENIS